MACNISTGAAAAILGPQAFDQIFLDGVIEVRTGAQPLNADAAPTGTLIARVTRNGGVFTPGSSVNGLRFVRDGRFASKDFAHLWKLKGSGSGSAGWFRLLTNAADSGDLSLSAIRIDGRIGVLDTVGDYQMFLPALAISPGTATVIEQWWFAIPPL